MRVNSELWCCVVRKNNRSCGETAICLFLLQPLLAGVMALADLNLNSKFNLYSCNSSPQWVPMAAAMLSPSRQRYYYIGGYRSRQLQLQPWVCNPRLKAQCALPQHHFPPLPEGGAIYQVKGLGRRSSLTPPRSSARCCSWHERMGIGGLGDWGIGGLGDWVCLGAGGRREEGGGRREEGGGRREGGGGSCS